MLRIVEKGQPLAFTREAQELSLGMSAPHLSRWHRFKIWIRKVYELCKHCLDN